MHRLLERIRADGPVPLAEYMAVCNAHYYATRDPLGEGGDFTTAPEISQIFGELTGAWLADAFSRLGAPHALLCELGPGRGTLMKDALRATRKNPVLRECTDLLLIETSPALRAKQKAALDGAHPRIRWQDTLDALPALPLLLVANEFFDALPIVQEVRVGVEWVERRVAANDRGLYWTPEGDRIRESCPAGIGMLTRIASHIRRYGGAALVIDYGYAAGEEGDTLQALKAHRAVDPLSAPGEADLTAHVDFAALARAARAAGVHAHGPVEQGTFLKRLGAELRAAALCKSASPAQRDAILSGLERLVAPHGMGTLFKVIAFTSSLESPAGF